MLYFLLSLILSLAISSALLASLVKSLKINWERRNRRPISYLAPVLITVVFTAITTLLTVPRLLDAAVLINKAYVIEEITPETSEIRWSTLYASNRRFYFNQWQFHPEADKTYRISYTPRSRFIVEMEEIAETINETN